MVERADPPEHSDERTQLLAWLQFHRDTLALKCEGLTGEQLAAASVPPSDLTLLGLVRHLTEMERVYLVYGLGGGSLELVYATEDDPEIDFEQVSAADPAEAFAAWRNEMARADAVIAAHGSLDDAGLGNGCSGRWNLHKVLQEYARHNGHADLLRERIDGTVGE